MLTSFFGSARVKIWLLASLVCLVLLVLAPTLALAVAVIHLVLTLLLEGGRLYLAWSAATPVADPELSPANDDVEPFISVHIATYEEPPELVCKTLTSLAGSEYQNFEVIVLDNNTTNPALYGPVEACCEKLGDRFRFYHFDGVRGAKAGALNLALHLTDPRAQWVLVLDADYQIQPRMLSHGAHYFQDDSLGLVQYPQAYRNGERHSGLLLEYRHFFDLYMKAANAHDSVLATGTAAFVLVGALREVGGWPTGGLTEDADLGVRLHRHGYKSVYVPERLARGLMPESYKALAKQRRRWVLGNAQSLQEVLGSGRFDLRRKLVLVFQLTAWANPLLWVIVTTCCATLLLLLQPELLAGSPALHWVMILTLSSWVVYFVGSLLLFLTTSLRARARPLAGGRAFLSHLALAGVGAVSWLELWVDSDKSFERTDKFSRVVQAGSSPWGVLTGCVLAAAAIVGSEPWLGACWLALAWLPFSRGLLEVELCRLRHSRQGGPTDSPECPPAVASNPCK